MSQKTKMCFYVYSHRIFGTQGRLRRLTYPGKQSQGSSEAPSPLSTGITVVTQIVLQP